MRISSRLKSGKPDMNNIYINSRGTEGNGTQNFGGPKVRGIRILTAEEMKVAKYSALNGVYHYIDGILKYDEDTRENILDRRMRIDCTTLSPDFITSGARQFDASNTGVSKYGSGSTTWKGLTASYQQTGEGLIDLKFENTGDYLIRIRQVGRFDGGITVYAVDENGNIDDVIIKEYGSVLEIKHYNGSASVSSVKFDGLEGKITEIRIMNVWRVNTRTNSDSGYKDGPLTITDGSK